MWWQWGSHRESRQRRVPDRRCFIYLAHLKSSPSSPVRCPFSPGVTADHREGTQLRQERSATEPHSPLSTPVLPDSRALGVVPATKLRGRLEERYSWASSLLSPRVLSPWVISAHLPRRQMIPKSTSPGCSLPWASDPGCQLSTGHRCLNVLREGPQNPYTPN